LRREGRIINILDKFGIEGAGLSGYWTSNGVVGSEDAATNVSIFYKANRKALLVVTNTGSDAIKASASFAASSFGCEADAGTLRSQISMAREA
jgi:hypothetical protein